MKKSNLVFCLYFLLLVLVSFNFMILRQSTPFIWNTYEQKEYKVLNIQSKYEAGDTFISNPNDCGLKDVNVTSSKVYGIVFSTEENRSTENYGINLSLPVTINLCGYKIRFENWSYIPKEDLCYDTNPKHERCWIKYRIDEDRVK